MYSLREVGTALSDGRPIHVLSKRVPADETQIDDIVGICDVQVCSGQRNLGLCGQRVNTISPLAVVPRNSNVSTQGCESNLSDCIL